MLGMGAAFAQKKQITVSGSVQDKTTSEPIEQATVQLLAASDSSFVTGVVSLDGGVFTLPQVAEGTYLLKVSFIGYMPDWKTLKLSSSESKVNVGKIIMTPDALLLKEATVTAEMPQIQVMEDTIIYNSDAFRVPEGSMLEELVKKLPGAEVAEDGTITINGKTVKKIMVDGKEFFGGDTKVAMKNIPTTMVDKVKSYEKKSDLARVTGIDDGEEETVLDLTVKKGMKQGWFGNTDLAYGTEDRYSGKLMMNRFVDDQQFSLIGSANNVNDMGFPGGGGGGRRGGGGRNGLIASKMSGANFAIRTDKLEMGGNVRYSHTSTDALTKSASETFLQSGNSFSNSASKNKGSSSNVNADLRFEWKPDTMTNIIFRPTMSYSTSDSWSQSTSATFNEDPYDYTSDPLGELRNPEVVWGDSTRVNANTSRSQSNSENKSFGGSLQLNRKLNSKGRNITFRSSFNYTDSDSESLSASNVEYFLKDSTYSRNRFNLTPGENWNYSLQATYSEPVFKNMFLQFSYKFEEKYSKSDRSTYDFSGITDYLTNGYPVLPENYRDSIDNDLSKFAEYYNYIHEAQVMLRVIRESYQFNVGVTVIPQETKLNYKFQGTDTTATRHVTNFTPNMRFRYRFSKTSQLNFDYRGRTSQPSMTDLLDITDDSDPLYITKGNPGLKPSFTNSFNLRYNTFIQEKQRSIFANMNFSNTLNSVSNKVTYIEDTGGRITQPENINGNWNLGGFFGFNTALRNKKFTVNAGTNFSYNNRVAYLYQNKETKKNTTKSLDLGERLTGSYRNDWLEVSLNGSLYYSHSENMLQKSANMDTYNFSYGASTNVTAPWGTRLSTDFSNNSRRGYSDASMNTNELIWNAQVSHSFLKGNAATLSFQVYDILSQQSNLSRSITAAMRRDTEYNAITSYCMVHFIYRLNIFGSKEARQGMRGGGGDFERTGPRGGGGGRGGFRGGAPGMY